MDNKVSNDFKVERLKYILNEISSLNQNTRSILTLYQSLATLILGSGVFVFTYWNDGNLDKDVAIISINALKYIFATMSIFLLLRLFANVASWVDYRKEETKLINDEIGTEYRKQPNLANFWRWDEFYIAFIMFLFIIVVWIFTNSVIIKCISTYEVS